MKNVPWRQFVGKPLHHRAGEWSPSIEIMYVWCVWRFWLCFNCRAAILSKSIKSHWSQWVHGWRDLFVIWVLLEASQKYWPPKNDWTTKHIIYLNVWYLWVPVFAASSSKSFVWPTFMTFDYGSPTDRATFSNKHQTRTVVSRIGRWSRVFFAITFIMCDMDHGTLWYAHGVSNFNSMKVSVSMCGLYQSPISSASTCYSASVWNPHSKNENT